MTAQDDRESAAGRRYLQDFGFGVLVGFFLLGAVVLLWERPYILFGLLALALAVQLRVNPRKEYKWAALFAAALGTPGELIEVYLGEWTYYGPDLIWGVPVWIPLIWANLFTLFHRLSFSLISFFAQWPPLSSPRAWTLFFGLQGLLILTLWGVSLALMEKMVEVEIFYAVFFTLSILFWNKPGYILIFMTGAVIGSVGEYICVQLGYWSYYNPLFKELGVGITLPSDWGISAILISWLSGLWRRAPELGWNRGG